VRQDARRLPAEARHLLAQQPLLARDVVVVDGELGRGKRQHRDCLGGVADGS
jgi:hypothetical protein